MTAYLSWLVGTLYSGADPLQLSKHHHCLKLCSSQNETVLLPQMPLFFLPLPRALLCYLANPSASFGSQHIRPFFWPVPLPRSLDSGLEVWVFSQVL